METPFGAHRVVSPSTGTTKFKGFEKLGETNPSIGALYRTIMAETPLLIMTL
jgi:hypothetical protein